MMRAYHAAFGALLGLGLLGLGGCNALPVDLDDGTALVVDRVAAISDAEARLLARAPCKISIGASLRELTPQQRRLLYQFCGLDPESPSPLRPEELAPLVRPQGLGSRQGWGI